MQVAIAINGADHLDAEGSGLGERIGGEEPMLAARVTRMQDAKGCGLEPAQVGTLVPYLRMINVR